MMYNILQKPESSPTENNELSVLNATLRANGLRASSITGLVFMMSENRELSAFTGGCKLQRINTRSQQDHTYSNRVVVDASSECCRIVVGSLVGNLVCLVGLG